MTTLDEQEKAIALQAPIDQLALSYAGAQQLIFHLHTIYQNLLIREESLTHLTSTIGSLARAIKVTSPDEYANAATFIVERINPALKEVDATYTDLISLAYKVWKTLLARKAVKAAPLEEGKMLVEVESLRWRRDEQAKAEERARIERLERERIAREAQIARLREERAAEIELLMKQGNVQAAGVAIERVANGDLGPLPKLDLPPIPPSFTPAPSVPKVAGVSTRTYWHFQVTNPAEIRREYLIPDEKLIKKIVESKHKDAEGIVGGIQVWSDEGMATKGRK